MIWWRRRNTLQGTAEVICGSPPSPLAVLSFEDAMNLEAFATEIRRYESENLTSKLGLDLLQCAIQGVSIANQGRGVTLLCTMSEAGRRAYASGQVRLMGGNLPILQDAETGHTFEIMRGGPAKLLKAAELSSLVVSAAHVISGMDIARKLGEVNRKLERLLRLRKVDQLGKLERIYASAKERLNEGQTPDGVKEIRRYREEVRELRAIWRRELQQAITDAPDPSNKPWWKRRKGVERDLANHINSELANVALQYVAFLMDLCLAEASGTRELLIKHTLPDELNACRRVVAALSIRASSLIKLRDGLEDAQESLAGLCEMISAAAGLPSKGSTTLVQV